ncbi:hypothetical protein K488DRAFT_48501 [Vararia minispora EC-137]|uniref:Uncharacterized protein n=1 Tax=Vararia minispora EC-137 TaxID=1314806 RepID=A0ACB8QMS8_9AGAM|nr:hypothetical protein K488DRAFT_48501 [Vararia minispora EC-137]
MSCFRSVTAFHRVFLSAPSARVLALPRFVSPRHVSFAPNRPSKRSYTPPTSAPEASQQKPKALTPLRRTAPSASATIRSNPTPTRSEIQPIFTYATAERYWLPSLRHRLTEDSVLLHDACWIPRWDGEDGKQGEVFVFANGSFVCWGLTEKDAHRFRKAVLQPAGAEIGPVAEPETEELEFVTDPSEETRLVGDLIILGRTTELSEPDVMPSPMPSPILPAETLLARYAFSEALSRSTSLSVLEVGLENHLASMSSLPLTLQTTGRPGMTRRALIMKLGELLKFRQGLNLNRNNFFDTPDFYWGEPVLERYFNSLSSALEVKARIRTVNEKITYAAEMQAVLRQLLTETSGARMEIIIILLIAVEVVIVRIASISKAW